jgi:ribosomal-protein-alanine N-acetyltransferase
VTEAAAPSGLRVEAAGSGAVEAAARVLEACLVEAWPVASIEILLASGRGLLWLLTDDAGAVRGALLGERVLDEAHVHLLAVERSLRRRGAGTALLAAALDDARATGARRILLEVRASETPALALYVKQGFEIVRRRSRYYADGEDALLLERDTGPGAAS